MNKKISNEYIRGLTEGEGCFSFSSRPGVIHWNGKNLKPLIPAFIISMHVRDFELLTLMKEKLDLKNKIYVYKLPALVTNKKIYKRGEKAMLIVREIGNLKNIIVPFFYGRLIGNKGRQFNEWLERIGSDPAVPESFKIVYQLHKSGYYIKNPKFTD